MSAAIGRAKSLSGAGGLSAGQHKFWAAAAADETKRLGVLKSELTTERAWRYQLGLGELALDKEIRAAGSLPSLAGPVKGWKAQLGRDKATVSAISKMLGYSNAYLAAHPAAKPGPALPAVTHTYGGDVADNLGTVLAAALGPFTGAARGGDGDGQRRHAAARVQSRLEHDRAAGVPGARARRRRRRPPELTVKRAHRSPSTQSQGSGSGRSPTRAAPTSAAALSPGSPMQRAAEEWRRFPGPALMRSASKSSCS